MAKEKKIKDKRVRVPKQIAGVKVPKKVRKAGNKALELADHPAALELAAVALSAAAAALQSKGRKRRDEAAPQPAQAGDGNAAVKLGDLVKVAALEGARRLLEGKAAPAEASDRPRRSKANGGPAAPAAREE